MGVTILPDSATLARDIWVRKCDYHAVRALMLESMMLKNESIWWLNTAQVFNKSGVRLYMQAVPNANVISQVGIEVDSVAMVMCSTKQEALHEVFLMFGPPQDRPAWTKRLTYELTLMGNDPHQPTTER